MMRVPTAVLSAFLAGAAGAVDTVFSNAAVYTVNPKQPWAEAVVVRDDEIVFVGTFEAARDRAGDDARVVDLGGRMLMPGIVDAHFHALIGAVSLAGVTIGEEEKRDVTAIQAAVKRYAADHPTGVVFGWGWSDEPFGPEGPTREQLDAAVPERPVYLVREDGHAGWLNSKALERIGPENAPDPAYLGRDDEGRPTGYVTSGGANVWIIEHSKLDPVSPASMTEAAPAALRGDERVRNHGDLRRGGADRGRCRLSDARGPGRARSASLPTLRVPLHQLVPHG